MVLPIGRLVACCWARRRASANRFLWPEEAKEASARAAADEAASGETYGELRRASAERSIGRSSAVAAKGSGVAWLARLRQAPSIEGLNVEACWAGRRLPSEGGILSEATMREAGRRPAVAERVA